MAFILFFLACGALAIGVVFVGDSRFPAGGCSGTWASEDGADLEKGGSVEGHGLSKPWCLLQAADWLCQGLSLYACSVARGTGMFLTFRRGNDDCATTLAAQPWYRQQWPRWRLVDGLSARLHRVAASIPGKKDGKAVLLSRGRHRCLYRGSSTEFIHVRFLSGARQAGKGFIGRHTA
jgi:hypothetical protein